MNQIYLFSDSTTDGKKQQEDPMTARKVRNKRRFLTVLSTVMLWCLGSFSMFAQTTHINPATEGGFNNGSTFAANGWTVVNSANNPWVVGTGVTNGAITGNSAYVSSNGTSNVYDNTAPAVNYFYRDITVPAGQSKIKLTFDWINYGETGAWDVIQVYVAPTSVVPAAASASAGSATSTPVPSGITGATSVFLATTLQGTAQSATVFLPANLAGTTFRLIFGWRNDGGGGDTPSGTIDNISLTSQVPGTFVSIASGNYGTASTWDANDIPSPYDNVTVSAGHTVTVDANNQGANNITVNGILAYGATPTAFTVANNLTVNAGGAVNVYNGTTGKTLNVGGNILNNGTIDISVGTTIAGLLTLNGSVVQTVSGTGTFQSDKIRNLTFSNTSTAIPNINWLIDVSVEYNLNITNAKINLGGSTFTYGTSATLTGNTFTFTDGGFMPGGKFSRWWSSSQTGYTTSAPTSIPTGAAGRYPFYNANGQQRIFYLGRTTASVAGKYAVTYNDAADMTTGLSVTDGAYTITDRWNGNFVVSTEGTSPAAASYWVTVFAPGAYIPSVNSTRVMLENDAIGGSHVTGTTLPSGQRSGVSLANLTSATGIYLGINSDDIPFVSVASGDWNNPAIWNKGMVPGCDDMAAVGSGHTVTVNSAGNSARTLLIAANGTLVIASGDLTVGCTNNNNTLTNNGTLTVSGGTLTVNGNMIHNAGSTFNQSGGDIIVDGNNGGATATSVASGTAIIALNTNLINWTGGTLTIVDPHAATSTTSNVLAYSLSTALHANVSANHILYLGDGNSTDAGGSTAGFRISAAASTGRLTLGTVSVNNVGGTNRHVSTAAAYGINGDLIIEADSEFRDSGSTIHIAGDVINNGTYVATGTLAFQSYQNGVIAAVNNAQTLTGSGTFANSATTPTANLSSFTVNNASAAGITLELPLELSGTFTLTAGKVNTSAVSLLTVGTVTGGSATAYVSGPLARRIATGNAATNFINFPVGKAAYAPIALAPVTAAASVISAEAFDSNTGTADASILNLATGRRWETAVLSGDVSTVNVRIADANLVNGNIPVTAPSPAGVYTATFGSVATFAAGTAPALPTVTANAGVPYTAVQFVSYANSNVCSGIPAPGATIASANNICEGTVVNLSVENTIPGAGVSYQWQQSADGITYTDIADATATTLTLTPTASTYYQLKVTCATGPEVGYSTAVHVQFANTVVSTADASRCGVGEVELNAVAGAGANIVWYDAATAGNVVHNGETFVTPTLNATTTYYAVAQSASAGTARVGTGTTTTSTSGITPFTSNYEGSRIQYLVKASELQASGLKSGDLTSLSFFVTSAGTQIQNQNGYTIKIAHTNAEALSGYQSATFTTVYGPVALTPQVVGTKTFNFDQPFAWNGTSNIVIEICHDNETVPASCPSCFGANSTVSYTATSFNSVFGRYVDDNVMCGTTNGTATSTLTNRPNMMFGGQVACNSGRVPVTATITTPPALTLSTAAVAVCEGQPSTTVVTITEGASDYDSFVWSPATGVTGDAATGWTFNVTENETYTLTAAQNSGNECVAVATVDVTVNATPTAITIAPVAAANCANTSIALTATGGGAPFTATIGTGTDLTGATETLTAFNNRFTGYRSQTIYTAAELNAMGIQAGKITSMAYEITTLGDAATNNNFTVMMGTVANANFATTSFLPTTGFTTVYGPETYTHTASGWQVITFATPYIWDGVSNLLVNVTMNGANAINNAQTYYTTTADNMVVTATSVTAATGTRTTKRPNVRFAVINNTGVLTWSPATNLYTDANATVPYVAGNAAATVYVNTAAAGTVTYTATATAGSCTVSQTVDVNVVDCNIVWGNVQWPADATITTCGTATVYGQVYKDGVTEAAGQGTGMKAWLGISSANTDPTTWDESAWHQATFNVQVGNNDEFMYDITGLAPGTYYYVYRYQYLTGAYYYGGYTPEGGGPWHSNAVSGVLTVNSVAAPAAAAAQSFCNSATVANLATTSGSGIKWYAAATGGTALESTTALVNGENYFASQTVNGCESIDRTEVVVTINTVEVFAPADVIVCDEYVLPSLNAGNYFTAANGGGTQLNAGDVITTNQTIYVYASANGCTAEDSFTVTIAPLEVTAPADVTACDSYTLPALTVGNYFTAASGGGTQLNAGDVITTNQTIYVYASANGCTAEDSFSVIINTIDVTAPADVTVCDSYTLPALTLGLYYTGQGGTGTAIPVGTVITETTTLYVYAESNATPTCSDEESFTITVAGITLDPVADVSVCGSYTLPALTVGNYYTATSGGGTQLNAGDVITANQTIYVFAANIDNCTAEDSFTVTITTVAAPTGDAEQVITAPTAAEATIEDIVTNEAGVIWFASEADALAGTPALATGTQVTAGTTYWGILTDGNCRSLPFAVLITEVLGNRAFDMNMFSYYPNPVKDVLNVKYSSDITSVQVFNMIGQVVLNKNINATEGSVDMSQLADGTYIVNVTAGGAVKTIKVVKKQ